MYSTALIIQMLTEFRALISLLFKMTG